MSSWFYPRPRGKTLHGTGGCEGAVTGPPTALAGWLAGCQCMCRVRCALSRICSLVVCASRCLPRVQARRGADSCFACQREARPVRATQYRAAYPRSRRRLAQAKAQKKAEALQSKGSQLEDQKKGLKLICPQCKVGTIALTASSCTSHSHARGALPRALLRAPVAHVWRCARSVCKRSGLDLPGHDAPDHDAVIQDILHTLGFQTLGRLSHRRGHSGACRYARARAFAYRGCARFSFATDTHSAVLDTHAGQGLTGNPFLRKRNPRGMGLRGPSF